MKIGQFGESFIPCFDGVARVMKAYAENLSKKGNEVYVVAPMYDAGFRGQYPYEIVDFSSFRFTHKLPYRIGLKSLDRHFVARMKQIDLDICHVHGPAFAGQIGLNYAKHHNIPLIGSFHTKFYDDIYEVTGSKAISKIGVKAIANFFEKCDEVWAVAAGAGETLREYGYKGDIVVMQNGTDKRPLNISKIPEVRAKYNITGDKPTFLYVGRLHWNKNLRRIIESCGLLKQKGFDFQLVFAGQGMEEKEVKELAQQCGIEQNLILTGFIYDVETLDCLYAISDLFIFPSIYDNSSLALREAAAQHTAGLAIKGSCTAEVIIDEVNGLLCEDTNESVCNKIIKFLQMPEEKRKTIEDAAYNTVSISWDTLMDTVLQRYENLMLKYKEK